MTIKAELVLVELALRPSHLFFISMVTPVQHLRSLPALPSKHYTAEWVPLVCSVFCFVGRPPFSRMRKAASVVRFGPLASVYGKLLDHKQDIHMEVASLLCNPEKPSTSIDCVRLERHTPECREIELIVAYSAAATNHNPLSR
ncbi:hypothetical protein PHLCEN_2v10414 [Hermanssonia centrifuga]|uniref:Uncharacterized protein n=1 Tax=Hermanssonia centrifuga TaxID=98765 RepID=A0A2R6NNZ8_9APHY|nr:hypothetical protein PHLCEN_2v10414 [Hermanssonia centrifuga]